MTRRDALHQSLASCGAALIAFIGVCHEVVGAALYPWGPAFFGGAVGWNIVGLLTAGCGLLLLAGTLHLIRFPVPLLAWVGVAVAAAVMAVAAVVHHQFHLFAASGAVAGAVTATFHRRTFADAGFAC